jgi:hypothetical protein
MLSLRLGREAVRRQASKAGGAASPLDRRRAGRSLEHPLGMNTRALSGRPRRASMALTISLRSLAAQGPVGKVVIRVSA